MIGGATEYHGNVNYEGIRTVTQVDDQNEEVDSALCIQLKTHISKDLFQAFRRRYKEKNPLAGKILMQCKIYKNQLVCPDMTVKKQVKSYFLDMINKINDDLINRM